MAAANRTRPLVLFVGSFPPAGVLVLGGNRNACKTLLESSFPQLVDLVLLDSTQVTAVSPSFLTRAARGLLRVAQFVRLTERHHPDVALLFASGGGSFFEKAACCWYGRLRGIRSLLFVRGGEFIDEVRGSRFRRWMAGAFLNGATRVLCQGETWRRFYHTEFGLPASRCPVIANWTAKPGHLAVGQRREYLDRPLVRILFMSRLDNAKGVHELLLAFQEVTRRVSALALTLDLAGEGTASSSARGWVATSGLADRIRFLGWVEEPGKTQALASSDIFALPSYREGLPNSMIEAMASGLPVIVTPVGSVPDAVTDGVEGLIVPARDVDRLADALERLVLSADLRRRLGRAGWQRAGLDFTIDRAVAQLLAVIRGDSERETPTASSGCSVITDP